jgi:hypothetical protein
MLTMGGGRLVGGDGGGVVVDDGGAVLDDGVLPVVVGPVCVVVEVEGSVVVVMAAGERCSSFSWKPTTTSAETQSPSTTRKGQLGPAPVRVDSCGIYFECNSARRNYSKKERLRIVKLFATD